MSEIFEHTLVTRRTARYFIAGGSQARDEIVFALHGYGESARAFLENCASLANERRCVIAPEGLSRFYVRGSHGDVGASWMTKDVRDAEILDQRHFLESVRHEVLHAHAAARISVVGFSQGTATACRWVARAGFDVERLVLFGGGVPPDLNEQELKRLRALDLTIAIGRNDRFLDDESVERELARLADADVHPRVVRFDGGHEIDAAALADVFR